MSSLAPQPASAVGLEHLERLMHRRRLADSITWRLGGPGRSMAVGPSDLMGALVGLVTTVLVLLGAVLYAHDLAVEPALAAFGLLRVLALMWPVRVVHHLYASEISLDSALLAYWLAAAGPSPTILYWVLASVIAELLRTHVVTIAVANVGLSSASVAVAALTYHALTGQPQVEEVTLVPLVAAVVGYMLTDHVLSLLMLVCMGERLSVGELMPLPMVLWLVVGSAVTGPAWAAAHVIHERSLAALVLGSTMALMVGVMWLITRTSEERNRLRLIVGYLHRVPAIADDADALRALEETARHLVGTDEVSVRPRPPAPARREIGFSLRASLDSASAPRMPERWLIARVRELDATFHPHEVAALETLALVAGDAIALRAAASETQWLATHDPLTTLANRTQLLDAMLVAEHDARGTKVEAAAVLLDIDGFKDINDEISHEAGDHVLAVLGPRIEEAVGPGGGVAARLGGDEFAVFVPAVDSVEAVQATCERIRRRIREPIEWQERALRLDASIGYTLGPAIVSTSLLREADAAMYSIKHGGKGGIARYLPTTPLET